ncbi:MAG: 3-phosphoshikimate 1-carboxyvinyltransferase [Bacteroidota bacterium]|nr:3-phosphoshikimate 1-carboxyvinyltransferase [Bacteroidota bacterium]
MKKKFMICVSLANKDIDSIFQILERPDVQMAEVRLDSCPLTMEEVEDLFSSIDKPLIATYRLADASQVAEAEAKLLTAIQAGAAFLDLDIDAPAMMCKRLRREAREAGTLLIRSFHDAEGTDSTRSLSAVAEKCIHLGADIVKIATTAASEADSDKVLRLYDLFPPENLVAFCMGDAGSRSRVECLAKGAPFSYAALSPEEATAPGQMSLADMRKAVYAGLPGLDVIGNEPVEVGCSKSCAQRAIILAALADGTSHISGYSPCRDNESAIEAAKSLGAKVSCRGDVLTITGTAGRVSALKELHAGESGFLTRMMIPVLAATGSTPVRITGEKTLLARPLPGAAAMLDNFGISLDGEKVPLTVSGSFDFANHDTIEIDGSGGSQLVSGLLAALPLCKHNCTIHLNKPKSIPYIFMTLDLMRQFGVNVVSEMEGPEEFVETQDWSLCDAITFEVKGGCSYKAADVDLEADWSAAANFMVAGAIFGKADIKGLDTKSLQADLSVLDILPLAGAAVSQEEESGIVHVVRGPLRGFEVDASNCPDLVPVMSVLAAFCQGESTITGVARLATKESNRPGVIVEMLKAMGVYARLSGDKLHIDGRTLESRLLTGRLLKGGNYPTYGDHRIAMALAVASLGSDSQIVMDDVTCMDKSFPAFMQTFKKFSGQ